MAGHHRPGLAHQQSGEPTKSSNRPTTLPSLTTFLSHPPQVNFISSALTALATALVDHALQQS